MRTTLLNFTILLTLSLGAVQIAPAEAAPCCVITAIDAGSGVVTARDQATAKTFRFVASDRRLLRSLKVGSAVTVTVDRRAGLSVQGQPATPVLAKPPTRPPKIDCKETPELCPGGKPPMPPTKEGTQDVFDQINDWCFENAGQCVVR